MTAAGLRVAVVTPYHRESEAQLARCVASVAAQRYRCRHFLVSDGHPQEQVDGWDVRHVRLGVAHGDYGDTPRAIGSLLAVAEGFDAIAYLDADNAYQPEHIGDLVAAWQGSSGRHAVLSSARRFVSAAGEPLAAVEDLDLARTADTNCLLLTGAALAQVALWAQLPAPLHIIGDQVFCQALLARGLSMAHLPRQSVLYTTRWRAHYHSAGQPAPPDARDIAQPLREAARWWLGLDAAQRAPHLAIMGFDPGPALAALLAGTPPQ